MHSPCIPEDSGRLQIDQSQLEDAVKYAHGYWCDTIATTLSPGLGDFVSKMFRPEFLLRRIPSFPSLQTRPTVMYLGDGGRKTLIYQGYSQWSATPAHAPCGIGKKTRRTRGFIEIGIQQPTTYRFADDDSNERSSHAHILSLAWSYVFSKKMAELCQSAAQARYNDIPTTTPTVHQIDVAPQNKRALRWWKAVLAQGNGWSVTLSPDSGDMYYAPWMVFNDSPIEVCPTGCADEAVTANDSPLSAEEAFEALLRFCRKHDSFHQLYASLAAVMMFPSHNRYRTEIQLTPSLLLDWLYQQRAIFDIPSWSDFEKAISHYMTLSCSTHTTTAALCGTFWERGIACNLVSTWLHPVLEELSQTVSQRQYYKLLYLLGVVRRPQISLLWLGAAISGFTPTIIRHVRLGTPPIDPHVWPWMGTLHSFMDDIGSGPYFSTEQHVITREDVWRILYLPPVTDDELHYETYPFTPWAPPGTTVAENCVQRVLSHINCSKHQLDYTSWTWLDGHHPVKVDFGFQDDNTVLETPAERKMSPFRIPRHQLDNQEASQNASINVFRWVVDNGEGIPNELVYRDSWLDVIYSDGEDDVSETGSLLEDESRCNSPLQTLDSVERWLRDT